MSATDDAAPGEEVLVIQPPSFARTLLPVVLLVVTGLGAIQQLVHQQVPWRLLFVLVALGMMWLSRKPLLTADTDGVKIRYRALVPWTDVTTIDRTRPNDRWNHDVTELVLTDGTRRPLLPNLRPDDIGTLEQLWQASRASP